MKILDGLKAFLETKGYTNIFTNHFPESTDKIISLNYDAGQGIVSSTGKLAKTNVVVYSRANQLAEAKAQADAIYADIMLRLAGYPYTDIRFVSAEGERPYYTMDMKKRIEFWNSFTLLIHQPSV